ncbi:MAG: DUF4349 domain-containing protein [Aquimonas sp.]|nr:DUF4349 domain-containing protein [Aquimonas sp.]
MFRFIGVLLCLIALSGCAEQHAAVAPNAPVQGVADPSSLLAYEHTVMIELSAAALSARMAEVRRACTEALHGRCSLLEYSESGGDQASGRLRMRLVPEAVEPIVAGAADGAHEARRSTRAEDLAVAVADNARQRERLGLHQQRLDALTARTDLSVAEHLQLARELSALESELMAAERQAAQQALRLETNLLTLEFRGSGPKGSRWSALGEAISDSMDNFVDGLIEAVELVAFGLPYLLLGFPIALLWWALWRLATRGLRRGRD